MRHRRINALFSQRRGKSARTNLNFEESKKVDSIADRNKDAFLGRSQGCKSKFNPTECIVEVNEALQSRANRRIQTARRYLTLAQNKK